mmetsp:Transcript_52525/g.118235  ORF Transcript_52525/g.118235 Transcript_52525/m.118235 type:complete len:121 (-) Transcript_52525:8-370(-)
MLVSRGEFTDPVSRRAVSRGECKSLDEHLRACGFAELYVVEAFDLLAKSAKGRATEEDGVRLAEVQDRSQAMLRTLEEGGDTPTAVPHAASALSIQSASSGGGTVPANRRRRWKRSQEGS